MIKCNICGAYVNDGSLYCNECGARIEVVQQKNGAISNNQLINQGNIPNMKQMMNHGNMPNMNQMMNHGNMPNTNQMMNHGNMPNMNQVMNQGNIINMNQGNASNKVYSNNNSWLQQIDNRNVSYYMPQVNSQVVAEADDNENQSKLGIIIGVIVVIIALGIILFLDNKRNISDKSTNVTEYEDYVDDTVNGTTRMHD